MLVNAAAFEQSSSSGPKRWKVISPVGAEPPARVAVSWTEPPMATLAEAAVRSVVSPLATATASSGALQAAVAGALSGSPE